MAWSYFANECKSTEQRGKGRLAEARNGNIQKVMRRKGKKRTDANLITLIKNSGWQTKVLIDCKSSN